MALDLWMEHPTEGRKPAVGCFYEIMLVFMRSIGQACYQQGAAIESTRNEIATGLATAARVMVAANGAKQIGRD